LLVDSAARIEWPDGKDFAFTVFDDPDAQTLNGCETVYTFLGDLGLRTTIGVWPCAPVRQPNSPGETCGNASYRAYVQELQRAGFEVGYHNTTPHGSFTPEIVAGFGSLREFFGEGRVTMANHYNAEAIYWGRYRLTGVRRTLYRAANLFGSEKEFFGHVRDSPYFWGDLCRERVQYCRNFIFRDINTLRACPWMPYEDPDRPYVPLWYASSEGANVRSFVETICEENQDRLEEERGACIMYAHFGHGFSEGHNVQARFRSLLTRLSKKNGWFVPVSTLLGHLRQQRNALAITPRQRATMEWRWLARKLMAGTS
jgi:hypothetical protein